MGRSTSDCAPFFLSDESDDSYLPVFLHRRTFGLVRQRSEATPPPFRTTKRQTPQS